MLKTRCSQCKGPNPSNNFYVCCGEYVCDKCYNIRLFLPACPGCGQGYKNNNNNDDHNKITDDTNNSCTSDEQSLRESYKELADSGHLGAIGRLDSLLAFLSTKYPHDKELLKDSRKYAQLNIDKCSHNNKKLEMSLDEQRELKAEMTGLLFSGMSQDEMQKEMERRVKERSPRVKIRNASQCGNCDQDGATQVCVRCDTMRYCNRTCQKADWKKHKKTCGKKKDWAMVSTHSDQK